MYRYIYYSCNSTTTITDIVRERVQAKYKKYLIFTLYVDGGPPAALKNENRHFAFYDNNFVSLKPKRFNRALFKDRVALSLIKAVIPGPPMTPHL